MRILHKAWGHVFVQFAENMVPRLTFAASHGTM